MPLESHVSKLKSYLYHLLAVWTLDKSVNCSELQHYPSYKTGTFLLNFPAGER